MRRASAVWVPAWHRKARPRRFSRNDLAAVMAFAQERVDSGEAHVVCVFDSQNPKVINYEVMRTRTFVHWSDR